MARRVLSETGYYHTTTRSAGQIALFEDDSDRRYCLRLFKLARDQCGIRILAWVLMTDHVHLVIDCGENSSAISDFMYFISARYVRYFNSKTGRVGTLFQGQFWSKPILTDAQLIATVHYVHMNPEVAGIARMREYHWSSYQEYAGKTWAVDTSTILDLFGSFESFDAYRGSPKDVVSRMRNEDAQDMQVLELAMELSDARSSNELRKLPRAKRNEVIRLLHEHSVTTRQIGRIFGIGASTVSRVLRM